MCARMHAHTRMQSITNANFPLGNLLVSKPFEERRFYSLFCACVKNPAPAGKVIKDGGPLSGRKQLGVNYTR